MSRIDCPNNAFAQALALCLTDEGCLALWFVIDRTGRVAVITNACVETRAHALAFAGGL